MLVSGVAGVRKDVALPAVLAAVLLMLAPAVARAGTYDVVACTASGGGAINRAWTIEPYNSSGEAAPPLSAFAIPGVDRACANAVSRSGAPSRRRP